jgi:hypothetical protein
VHGGTFDPGAASPAGLTWIETCPYGMKGDEDGMTRIRTEQESLALLGSVVFGRLIFTRGASDRLSSELRWAMEGVELLSHVRSRLEGT